MSSIEEERLEKMRGPGFTLLTDTSNQFVDYLSHLPAADAVEFSPGHHDYIVENNVSSSTAGLIHVSNSLAYQVRKHWKDSDGNIRGSFYKRLGISKHDRFDTGVHFYKDGFGDVDFVDIFAPIVANAVTLQFVEEDYISAEQQEKLTLGDWANMIGSGWFSTLIHQFTTAKLGTYGGVGNHFSVYNKYGLAEFLKYKVSPLGTSPNATEESIFSLSKVEDDSRSYLTARLTQDVVKRIRRDPTATSWSDKKIQSVTTEEDEFPSNLINQLTQDFAIILKSDIDTATWKTNAKQAIRQTYGCPVARYSGMLPVEALQDDEHLRKLINRSEVTIEPSRDTNRVRYRQAFSAIDYSLMSLAQRIDRFEKKYGTPVFNVMDGELSKTNVNIPPTNVLCPAKS